MQSGMQTLQGTSGEAALATPLQSIMGGGELARYLVRKRAEIALINDCLGTPLKLPAPRSVEDVIAQKLKLAAALRAHTSLHSWAITETARPDLEAWNIGPYRVSFGYQRADLEVRGPAVYPALESPPRGLAVETIYTSSGMSALSVLLHGLLHVHDRLCVHAHRGGYGETRELLERFRDRVRLCPTTRSRYPEPAAGARIVLVDSVAARSSHFDRPLPRDTALVVCDTTCWDQGSRRVERVIRWARRHDVPLALVRSHAKLDCLGIEYGRLGSLVLEWRRAHASMRNLIRSSRDSARLLGVAPIPAHLPPFAGSDAYRAAGMHRTAAIVKATRRLRDRLRTTSVGRGLNVYPHGVYVTIATGGTLRVKDVKRAVDSLCGALSVQGLPVRHAGSFGFDFVALEWFPDPITGRNVIRVAPGDLPCSVMDHVAQGIVRWFALQTDGASPS